VAEGKRAFEADAKGYSTFRPSYTKGLLSHVTARLMQEPPRGGFVLDVGSGTGIFTRQLRAALPDHIALTGIEPSPDMRAKASALSPAGPSLTYADGTAERLHNEDGSVRAVIAASAAHWFERPAFYAEARRVLMPAGLLAIVEYVRDEKSSPAAAALIRFTAENGGEASYGRPDCAGEIAALEGFGDVEIYQERSARRLTPEQYVGLAMSSSHARPAIANLGQERAEAILRQLGADHAEEDGLLSFGYLFQAFTARRS
jgi:SAM-dependent methyltransferase